MKDCATEKTGPVLLGLPVERVGGGGEEEEDSMEVDEKESGRTTGRGPSVSDTRAKVAAAADDENYAYNSARSLRNRPTTDVRTLLLM